MGEIERIKRVFDWLIYEKKFKNREEIALFLGYNKTYLSQIENGKTGLSDKFLNKVATLDSLINKDWLFFGKKDMLLISESEKKEREEPMPAHTNNQIRNEVHLKEYPAHVEVKVVTTKARAGYMDAYYADEYLEEMPTIIVQTDREYSGKYLAFEVDGDSMEPAFNKGNIITGREIRRDLWRSKLHIHDNFFIIAHNTEGILIKQILEHNVETGDILCHSMNDFYNDFTINLRDVSYLFNVIDKREGRDSLKRFLL